MPEPGKLGDGPVGLGITTEASWELLDEMAARWFEIVQETGDPALAVARSVRLLRLGIEQHVEPRRAQMPAEIRDMPVEYLQVAIVLFTALLDLVVEDGDEA